MEFEPTFVWLQDHNRRTTVGHTLEYTDCSSFIPDDFATHSDTGSVALSLLGALQTHPRASQASKGFPSSVSHGLTGL